MRVGERGPGSDPPREYRRDRDLGGDEHCERISSAISGPIGWESRMAALRFHSRRPPANVSFGRCPHRFSRRDPLRLNVRSRFPLAAAAEFTIRGHFRPDWGAEKTLQRGHLNGRQGQPLCRGAHVCGSEPKQVFIGRVGVGIRRYANGLKSP